MKNEKTMIFTSDFIVSRCRRGKLCFNLLVIQLLLCQDENKKKKEKKTFKKIEIFQLQIQAPLVLLINIKKFIKRPHKI